MSNQAIVPRKYCSHGMLIRSSSALLERVRRSGTSCETTGASRLLALANTRVLLRNNIMPRVLLIIREQRAAVRRTIAASVSGDLSTFNEITNFLPAFSSALMSKGTESPSCFLVQTFPDRQNIHLCNFLSVSASTHRWPSRVRKIMRALRMRLYSHNDLWICALSHG